MGLRRKNPPALAGGVSIKQQEKNEDLIKKLRSNMFSEKEECFQKVEDLVVEESKSEKINLKTKFLNWFFDIKKP